MFKTIMRFLVITLIAVALSIGIYRLIQPAGPIPFRSSFENFGGERGFREGGFGLISGLFGITGNLILVAVVTIIVVSMQKVLNHKPEPATMR